MNIDFELSNDLVAEFGVGQRVDESVHYYQLPADDTVQQALLREARSALSKIDQETVNPPHFDPAEKYEGNEYLVLPLNHELGASLRELHEADFLTFRTPQLQDLKSSFCYFLRGTDKGNRRLTALNRTSQFKATLGRQGRLMMMLSDALHVISDPVLQLNAGFDIVIDSEFIHIFHPASFRALANVDDEIAKAVPRNIEAISQAASYVDWSNIEEFA